ncbi:hypothetical protein H0H87_001823 [Tephrocybe sp. NHM501043]|nr:hypothetical protein H0H87_001823 [Tephrocybe sp. NHM501043]
MASPVANSTSNLADSLPADESCELLGPTALVRFSTPLSSDADAKRIFDVSKQVVGQMFVHGANVLVSDMISDYTSGNACVFYFLHILLDTTLGVALLYGILYALSDILVERLQWKGFESGVYGSPPSIKFWARQAAVYVLALTTMKIIVIILIVLIPGMFTLGEWLLSWTRIGNGDSLQVILYVTIRRNVCYSSYSPNTHSTMGIFPIIMNVLQFWLIDSIVKASTKSVALDDNSSDPTIHDREPLFRASSEDDDDEYRHDDIEHARRSLHPPRKSSESETSETPEEYKSGTASPNEPAEHSYPPSLTNSVSSGSSMPPRSAKNLLKNAKRRAAPAPLNVRNDYPPAVNSPSALLSSAQPVMPVPLAPVQKAEVEVAKGSEADAWAETWDEEDDWANRVGEEDWTGRRIEGKQAVLKNVWDASPAIRVSES